MTRQRKGKIKRPSMLATEAGGCLPLNSPMRDDMEVFKLPPGLDLRLDEDRKEFGKRYSALKSRKETLQRALREKFCVSNPRLTWEECNGCETCTPGHRPRDLEFELNRIMEEERAYNALITQYKEM